MATYSYRCDGCGGFDLRMAMGTAVDRVPCPACSAPARRVFTAPMQPRVSAGLAALHSLEERSKHEPPVVDRMSGTPRRTQPVTRNPLHAKLPRP